MSAYHQRADWRRGNLEGDFAGVNVREVGRIVRGNLDKIIRGAVREAAVEKLVVGKPVGIRPAPAYGRRRSRRRGLSESAITQNLLDHRALRRFDERHDLHLPAALRESKRGRSKYIEANAFGRPSERIVCPSPSRLACSPCQASLPYGRFLCQY